MLAIDPYLDRIDYHGPRAPTLATLRALHRAHLLAVPFENLDIGLGRPIRLDEAAFYDKIVRRRRGGFCYELNGLFAALLRALGFDVTLLSARVAQGEGFGPEFDHLVLRVQLDGPWLADVGFGDCFLEPLRLVEGIEQCESDRDRCYRLLRDGAVWQLQERQGDRAWGPQHLFSLLPRQLKEFAGMCHYQQTAPESHFTQKRICSRATPGGRVSLSDRRLILTEGSERRELELESEAAWQAALREHFGVVLNL